MKNLFKPVDVIVDPRGKCYGKENYKNIIEVSNIYGVTNTTLTTDAFLNVAPVHELDLEIRRHSLLSLFSTRVEFLLSNTIDMLENSLKNLQIAYEKAKKYNTDNNNYLGIWLEGYNAPYSVIKELQDEFSYIFDARFYFDDEFLNYVSIPTIIMAINAKVYNRLKVNINDDLFKEKEVKELYLSINKIFAAFVESLYIDFENLYNEGKILFNAGNYTQNQNGGYIHSKQLLNRNAKNKEVPDTLECIAITTGGNIF